MPELKHSHWSLKYPELKVVGAKSGGNPSVRILNRLVRVALMRRPVYSSNAMVRVLEIGSGNGSFSSLLRRYCPKAQIVASEFSEAGTANIRKTDSIGIRCSLPSLPFRDKSFDIVVLFHVLEHLASPLEGLNEIRRVLSHDGVALGAVPCYSSIVATILRDSWTLAHDAGHLHLYSKLSLNAACAETGLRVIWSATRQAPWNVFPSKEKGDGARRGAPDVFLPQLKRVFSYPFALTATVLDLGDELDFVAVQE